MIKVTPGNCREVLRELGKQFERGQISDAMFADELRNIACQFEPRRAIPKYEQRMFDLGIGA